LSLEGLGFVLTGTLSSMTRAEAKDLITAKGGKVVSSVGKGTSYLVSGSSPGSKFNKAIAMKVPILDENQFLALLEKDEQGGLNKNG
jgi:DNA ligase (NAD+)